MHTPEARAVYVNARIARAVIRAMGMYAANMQRQHHGMAVAYEEAAFCSLIDDERIGENDVIADLRTDP